MTHKYLTRGYTFPIPSLTITFSAPAEQPRVGPVQAIADTGADMTILPTALVQSLRLQPIGYGQLRSQWGELHPTPFYLLDVRVDGLVLPNVQVASDDGTKEVIVGRNVLNKLALLLDGPEQQTDLLDQTAIKRLRGDKT